MSSVSAAIVSLFAAFGLPSGVEVLDTPEVPDSWSLMVDPFDPLDSSQFMDAVFTDVPRGFIVDTCIMESGCRRPLGVHVGDAWAGRRVYDGLVRRGKVDAACQFYAPDGTSEWYEQWSTIGNHGLMYGYNRRHIGTCFPIQWFEIPIVSALAAARKARSYCEEIRASGNRCTGEALRLRWANAKTRKRRRRTLKLWRERLAKHKARRDDVDWQNPPTMEDFYGRKQATEIYE